MEGMAIIISLAAWIIGSFVMACIRGYFTRRPTPIPLWKDFLFIVLTPVTLIVIVGVKLLRWLL